MAQISFVPAPGWPELDPAFLPPAGWRPDPAWPQPPSGWQFYRDAYGYPTPPPPELWQPWRSTDWSAGPGHSAAALANQEPAEVHPDEQTLMPPVRVRRRPRWLVPLVALLVLALVGGGVALAWPRLHRGSTAPAPVSSLAKLYDPALPIGTASYQYVGAVPAKSFEGSGACITRANAAVAAAQQAVAGGTDRGWVSVTWRFADAAAASKAWSDLNGVLDGCTESSYKLGSPVTSGDQAQQWVQYSQTAADGADHGRVVLSTDANTLSWTEGGRSDMGKTAFAALRERLATLG